MTKKTTNHSTLRSGYSIIGLRIGQKASVLQVFLEMVTGFGYRNNVTISGLLDGLTMTTSAYLPLGPFRNLKTSWFVLRSQFLNIMLIWQLRLSCCRLSCVSVLRTFGVRIWSGCFSASWSDQRISAYSLFRASSFLVFWLFGKVYHRFRSL